MWRAMRDLGRDEKGHLTAGATVAGYRIVRTLGAGGFGVTYEGVNDLGDRVAIKEFLVNLGVGTTALTPDHQKILDWALTRFRDTAIDLRKLSHPNIVKILHYVPAEASGFLIMELVEGKTLSSYMRERGALEVSEARELIEPVLDALAYVHETGRLHRDVAPDNIMLRSDGSPVLIDFGALKSIESDLSANETRAGFTRALTATTHAVYKQYYSSPEQREARGRLAPASDIYAIAGVLFRALSGRAPMDAGDRVAGLLHDGRDPGTHLGTLGIATIPDGVAKAIDQAMSIQVTARPRNIAEFKTALGWGDARSSTPAAATVTETTPTPAREAPTRLADPVREPQRNQETLHPVLDSESDPPVAQPPVAAWDGTRSAQVALAHAIPAVPTHPIPPVPTKAQVERPWFASPTMIVAFVILGVSGGGWILSFRPTQPSSQATTLAPTTPDAAFVLALRLSNGEGVARDEARAFQLFLSAANDGHVPAMRAIATRLNEGRGGTLDRRAAAAWERTARVVEREAADAADLAGQDLTARIRASESARRMAPARFATELARFDQEQRGELVDRRTVGAWTLSTRIVGNVRECLGWSRVRSRERGVAGATGRFESVAASLLPPTDGFVFARRSGSPSTAYVSIIGTQRGAGTNVSIEFTPALPSGGVSIRQQQSATSTTIQDSATFAVLAGGAQQARTVSVTVTSAGQQTRDTFDLAGFGRIYSDMFGECP